MQLSLISLALTKVYGGAAAFSPSSLFASGEQGAWYDPSDLSTMFQDSAGTTPVTADGQPVGLILDKSKVLVLGSELVTNGDFSSATGWSVPAGLTIGGGVATATAASGYLYRLGNSIVAGRTYEVSFDVSEYSGTATIRGYIQATPVFGSTVSGNGHFTHRLTATATNVNSECGLNMSSGFNGVIDNFSIKEIAGNHATQATAASRPLYKTDGTYHWLQFDGVDDSLSTAAIDFTSVNKTGIFAGTYIVDSTNWRILAIQGASRMFSNPSVGLQIPAGSSAIQSVSFPSSAATYSAQTGGTTSINTKGVFSSLIDRSVSSRSVVNRINGSEVNATGWAIESGFYGNNPLFIGGAGGEAYNGKIYSLIIRGALSTADEITATETWVNQRTGAY